MFSTFPVGTAGLGLLLLRLTLSIASLIQGGFYLFESGNTLIWMKLFGLAVIIAGFSLVIGLLTPLVSLIVLIETIFLYIFPFSAANSNIYPVFLTIAISTAIMMLGPGAYSLDARIFGRREIIIPDRPSES